MFILYLIMTDEDLIIFDETPTYGNKLKELERELLALQEQLNMARQEINSLRNALYDHINFNHDGEIKSRFHIQHVHRINSYQYPVYTTSGSSSMDEIIMDT